MLILQPTSGDKTITIAPRNNDLDGSIVLTIRRDGDGKEETISNATLESVVNFTEVTFQSSILEEDSTYYLEITNNGFLWYRDKIYVTTRSAYDIEFNKHIIGGSSIYKTYNSVDDNTYIIGDSGSVDTGGGDTGGGSGVPVIDPSGSYFITLNKPFRFFIPTVSDPRPTSWDAYRLPDGLTLNNATAEVTGTLTGEERLEVGSFTATNIYGTSAEKLIFFRVITDDTTILAAPTDLRSSFFGEPVALNFGFNWTLRPYDLPLKEAELYRDGVRSRAYNSFGANISESTTPHKYKVRFIGDAEQGNDVISPFSDEFLFNWYEHTIALEYENMDLSGNIPITAPKKEYYIQKNVVDFEFDAKDIIVNNPTSFKGQSINLSIGGTVASTGSFDAATGIMKTTFTGTVDDDYSVSRWFKGVNDNGEDSEFRFVQFFFCDNDPYTFSAPNNVSVDNTDTDDKPYLTWDYPPYNTVVSLVEIYNNDVLVKTIYNAFDRKYSGTGINLVDGNNVIKVRFKDENDNYSPFTEITVTGNPIT